MSRSDLARREPSKIPAALKLKVSEAVGAWLEELTPHTRRSYRRGLLSFAQWLVEHEAIADHEKPDVLVETAGAYLLRLSAPEANGVVGAWLHDLLYPDDPEEAYARATVEMRLASLRWAVRHARRLGHTTWVLDVPMPKPRKDETGRLVEKEGRDMRAPTPAESRKMLEVAQEEEDPRAWFVVSAVLREGYREHEIRQLDFEDIDLRKRTVMMVRKKRHKREPYPLTKATTEALRFWLKQRGNKRGALLYGGRHGCNPKTRVGHTILWEIMNRVGCAAGMENGTSPHKCRHRACTELVRAATKHGYPEEELLRLTGHSSRDALRPYYEAINANRTGRQILESITTLLEPDEEENEEEEDDD